MRGDIVFSVFGRHTGRAKDHYVGTFRTREEATQKLDELAATERQGENWAARYHDRGFEIREVVVDTDFEIPSRPKPRDRYLVEATALPGNPNHFSYYQVDVFRRDAAGAREERVTGYRRHHTPFQTFEPFRQAGRELALVSLDYTRSAVLDLVSGEVIATEAGNDFCPVGFYVPDWWDLHDGRIIPGSQYWNVDKEWPTGQLGFVWGCQWGDDTSWKLQLLDLSRVTEGVLRRDERFGYLELDTRGYTSPCFDPAASLPSRAPSFLRVWRTKGVLRVSASVPMELDLDSGKPLDWQRLRIDHFE